MDVSVQLHSRAALPPGKRSVSHRTGGLGRWWGKSRSACFGVENICCPCRWSNFDSSVVKPEYALGNTGKQRKDNQHLGENKIRAILNTKHRCWPLHYNKVYRPEWWGHNAFRSAQWHKMCHSHDNILWSTKWHKSLMSETCSHYFLETQVLFSSSPVGTYDHITCIRPSQRSRQPSAIFHLTATSHDPLNLILWFLISFYCPKSNECDTFTELRQLQINSYWNMRFF